MFNGDNYFDKRHLPKPWLYVLFIVASLSVCWREFADRWGIRSEKLVVETWRTRTSRIKAGGKAMHLRIIYEFRPSIFIARTYISRICGCALCTSSYCTHFNWQWLLRCCPHFFVCCPLFVNWSGDDSWSCHFAAISSLRFVCSCGYCSMQSVVWILVT